MDEDGPCRPRIVVVGPCAAGKSTLVSNLRRRGYTIHACGQEHSFVPQLWQRVSHADVLIFLDVTLPTVAQRQRRSDWTQADLDEQHRRLAHARAHCHLYLPTDNLTREQVAGRVADFLQERGIMPVQSSGGDDEN